MMSQPYVDGITEAVTHDLGSSLIPGQIAAGQDTLTVSVVCPDRWFFGDLAVLTSRDGRAFAGQVEAMDVCTGEVTIRLRGSRAREQARDAVSAGRASARVPSYRHQGSPATGTSRLQDPGSRPPSGPCAEGRPGKRTGRCPCLEGGANSHDQITYCGAGRTAAGLRRAGPFL
jgi:hypothetical protein